MVDLDKFRAKVVKAFRNGQQFNVLVGLWASVYHLRRTNGCVWFDDRMIFNHLSAYNF